MMALRPPTRLGLLCRLGAFALLSFLVIPGSVGRAATPAATIVLTNPSFQTQAVDVNGVAWGQPMAARSQLWRSVDEGASWTQVSGWNAIGRRPMYITPLASGALLVAYDTGFHWAIARSGDGGASWTTVLTLPCIQADCTVRYTTLSQDAIVEGDGYVFLGTYNNASAGANTNYIYRSADDGRTWAASNTTTNLRHIHGLAFDSAAHRLYVLSGDTPGTGVLYSADDGSTLQPLCADYRCVAIESIIDGGSLIFGTDNPGGTNHIVELDSTAGTHVDLDAIAYPSYSAERVGNTWLVAETHEAGAAITDPQIHLYGSNDGGTSWSVLYAATIPGSGDYEMHIENVYPNGDIVVDVGGQGTLVLRLGTPPPPPPPSSPSPSPPPQSQPPPLPVNTAVPVVVGTLRQQQPLSASTGSWSNNPTGYAYQWRRCGTGGLSCVDIASAVSSAYRVQAADVGSTLRVQVTASNAAGLGVPAASAATAGVQASRPRPPVNTSPPVVHGMAQTRHSLSASKGTWLNSPFRYAYQWQRCNRKGLACGDIAGATSSLSPIRSTYVGSTLRVRVTAWNAAGHGVAAESAATAIIKARRSS